MAKSRRSAVEDCDGQIWVAALFAFVPLLVLLLGFINMTVVTVDRTQRQSAADAAALAMLTPSARSLNTIANNNIAMCYVLGEAIAEEAFIRAVKASKYAARAALCAAESACDASIGIAAPACATIPILEFEYGYLSCLSEHIGDILKPLCSFPGSDDYPRGGELFLAMKQLEEASTLVAGEMPPWERSATTAAQENGAEGCVVWPSSPVLPVQLGEFRDLGDPTRYGSQDRDDDIEPPFVRGFHPILGLPMRTGPLQQCGDKFRTMLYPAVLVGATAIYDLMLDEVCEDWFGPQDSETQPRSADALPRPHLLDGLPCNGDIAAFRARQQRMGIVWGRHEALVGGGVFPATDAQQVAYAQAELYNGTSWDLFTADWRVRLVPASILEMGTVGAAPAPRVDAPLEVRQFLTTSPEVLAWLNGH